MRLSRRVTVHSIVDGRSGTPASTALAGRGTSGRTNVATFQDEALCQRGPETPHAGRQPRRPSRDNPVCEFIDAVIECLHVKIVMPVL